ncbi:hypothetical protein WME98_34375 [Sorangium sp. So ce296]|uniref:hypothetical protein n=1 Tax=Sorangium sp. So ce296 TaxID=3133296 RepID=UPI003F620CCC
MAEPRSYSPSDYFPRPAAERTLGESLASKRRLWTVLAPDLAGKRWLVEHLLGQQEGTRTLWLDARSIHGPGDAARQLATDTGHVLPRNITRTGDLSVFLETLLDRPTILVWRHVEAFEEPGRHERSQVRHAMREWSTASAYKSSFRLLRQAILTSKPRIEYYRNVSEATVTVPDLDAVEIERFASRLGVHLPGQHAERLHRAIGGHIYFLRLALRHRTPGLSIEDLCKKPLHPGGPFREMYARFKRWLDGVSREERAGTRRLLEYGVAPQGYFADELEQRGVFEGGRSGIRYGLFEAFLKEYHRL